MVPPMTFIFWNEVPHIGIDEIDVQHKQLVNIINELCDIRPSQNSQAAFNGILSRLIDYAEYHFDFEEELMNQLNYSKLEEHKAEHQKFRNQIKEIQESQTEERFHIEDKLMIFLEDWFTEHILNEDMKALSFKG
jgi:hemerythrin-like metal-binding protein